MNINDLLEILRSLQVFPELIKHLEENEIFCSIHNNRFNIKVCCEGHGVILTLNDGSKVDFNLHDQDKEIFEKLFRSVKEHSKKYNYNRLLKEFSRYESPRDNLGNY